LRATAERYAARIPGLAAKTWDSRKVSGDDWALLGDAGRLRGSGDGRGHILRFAIGRIASAAAPQAYDNSWREDFGAELRRAAEMRRAFYGNFWGAPFTERMIEFARGTAA
jgi:flavin-dependent dehydrogenase